MAEPFNQYSVDYLLKDVFVMKFSPKIRHMKISERVSSSFLFIVRGQYHYASDQIDFYAESGDMVYLPQSARYSYTVLSEKTECIQVEFKLEMHRDGLVSHKNFSEHPVLLRGLEKPLNFIFNDLLSTYYRDAFLTISFIYQLISYLENACGEHQSKNSDLRKIEPAIQFIEQNFYNKIYLSELADLCGISQSHLRRLFRQHLGISPIKYKNSILMKTACNMLRNEELNISEIAEALHFNDIYTFSQLFKKEIGISPKKYMDAYGRGKRPSAYSVGTE